MPRAKRGFTLIEILIATAVAVLIMGAITSVFYYLLVIPPQQTDQLNAENQLRLSLDWIQNDGVQAHSFIPNATPYPNPCEGSYNYGHFSSYTEPNCADLECTKVVAYRYDDDNNRLIREESVGNGDPTNRTIAFNIANVCNVSFTLPEGDDNTLIVSMAVTLNEESQNNVRKEISITDTRYIEMRAEP